MSSIRILVVLGLAGAVSAVLAPGCAASAAGTCASICDKAESCGDIDSVKADQCHKQCDANATVDQAALDLCLNKNDIVSATSQCLGRACTDYAKCLGTVPSCQCVGACGTSTGTGISSTGPGHPGTTGPGGTTGTGVPGGSISCDEATSTQHVCFDETGSSSGACPGGYTMVSACPTSNELGTCTVTSATYTIAEHFYAGGNLTAAQAQSACASIKGAVWTSG